MNTIRVTFDRERAHREVKAGRFKIDSDARRVYYWEHPQDESQYHRSTRAIDIAEIWHSWGCGDVGVIIDDGGLLSILPLESLGTSIRSTAAALAGLTGG